MQNYTITNGQYQYPIIGVKDNQVRPIPNIDLNIITDEIHTYHKHQHDQLDDLLPSCSKCGTKDTASKDKCVATIQSPLSFLPSTICASCLREVLHNKTILSAQEALLCAYLMLDVPTESIESITDLNNNQISTVRHRINQKQSKAEQLQEQATNTIEMLTNSTE